MIKNTVINAELGYALATARHKDAIVICDANMPIPDGCNVIDVSLIRGVPTLEQTMCAILNVKWKWECSVFRFPNLTTALSAKPL